MISLKNFSIGYKSKILLENVSTIFEGGNLTSLIGRNGSGKSTLMKALSGLNQKYTGEIFIDKKNLKDYKKIALAKHLSFVNTERPKIANLTCANVVALGRMPYTDWIGRLSQNDKKFIDKALYDVGMTDYVNRRIDTLSDGECQKIMIARAIAQNTDIIILDEPTSFLDLPTRREIAILLRDLTMNQGKTIIFSTHELDIALDTSDYIALIDNGKLYNLPVSEMITQGHIERLFSISQPKILRR